MRVENSNRAIIVACLLVASAGLLHFANFGFDDAFISFRYAENLVAGHGLVFNPGERVEGFSNPLWTLLLTLPILLGADQFELGLFAAAKLMGALSTLATVLVVARTTTLIDPTRPGAVGLLAPLVVASAAPLLAWGMSGLETPLVALLVALAVHFELAWLRQRTGSRTKAAACWLLAALTRPEPVVLFAVALCWRLGVQLFTTRGSNAPPGEHRAVALPHVEAPHLEATLRTRLLSCLRRELPALLAFLLPYASLLLARRAYYGSWLPNTYYAKMYANRYLLTRGSEYLEFAFDTLHGDLLLGVSLAVVVATRRFTAPLALLSSLVLVQGLIVLREGGDWMPGLRFLVPSVPLAALLVQHTWDSVRFLRLRAFELDRPVPHWLAPPAWVQTYRHSTARLGSATWSAMAGKALRFTARGAVLVACALSIHGSFDAVRVRGLVSGFRQIELDSFTHFATARWMQTNLDPHALLALGEAGVIPYYTRMPILDLFGLVDPHIARMPGQMHIKFDLDYVLARAPRYFFFVGRRSPEGEPQFEQEHARTLYRSAEFQRGYALIHEFDDGFVFERQPLVLPPASAH